MTPTPRPHVFRFMPADIPRKTHEAFLFFFLPGDADLVGINDDDEVTGIDVRSENSLLFSAQKPGRLDRDPTEHLIFGIDQPPFAIHFIGFGGKRLHRRSEKGTEATGRVGDCQPAESGVELVLKVLSRNYNAPQFSSRR